LEWAAMGISLYAREVQSECQMDLRRVIARILAH